MVYPLAPPDAPVATLANGGPELVQVNEGEVSEAPDRQIVAGAPCAWLNNAAPTGPGVSTPMGHSVGGGAGTNGLQTVVLLAPEVPEETDPMNIALIPPTDITPEAAVVAYPNKPIHTQSHPLNRHPQGALQS